MNGALYPDGTFVPYDAKGVAHTGKAGDPDAAGWAILAAGIVGGVAVLGTVAFLAHYLIKRAGV